MQKRNTIINVPLVAGLALSIAIHVTALYGRSTGSPAQPRMDPGETVIQLTLYPSLASHPAAPESSVPSAPRPAPAPQPAATSQPLQPQPMDEPSSVESVEQDASLLEDKGVMIEATATSIIQPIYPRISRRRGEEGVVTLAVEVLASGRAGRIEMIQSSGHPRLDDAAREAAREASFSPATQLGRTVDSTTELSFTFRLTDE